MRGMEVSAKWHALHTFLYQLYIGLLGIAMEMPAVTRSVRALPTNSNEH